MISDKTVDKLNALPLPDVMRNNGYLPASQTARSVFYRCPFHDEKNGSFCVSKFPQRANAMPPSIASYAASRTGAKG